MINPTARAGVEATRSRSAASGGTGMTIWPAVFIAISAAYRAPGGGVSMTTTAARLAADLRS
jgi:hypothetical protein